MASELPAGFARPFLPHIPIAKVCLAVSLKMIRDRFGIGRLKSKEALPGNLKFQSLQIFPEGFGRALDRFVHMG